MLDIRRMGTPATPTSEQRAETLRLAQSIVESVEVDGEGPLDLPDFSRARGKSDVMRMLKNWWGRVDVQAFRLAQDLVDTRRALDAACDEIADRGDAEYAERLRALDFGSADDEPELGQTPEPSAA